MSTRLCISRLAAAFQSSRRRCARPSTLLAACCLTAITAGGALAQPQLIIFDQFGVNTHALDVNDAGDVILRLETRPKRTSFIVKADGTITPLALPSSFTCKGVTYVTDNVEAVSIDNSGRVAGWSALESIECAGQPDCLRIIIPTVWDASGSPTLYRLEGDDACVPTTNPTRFSRISPNGMPVGLYAGDNPVHAVGPGVFVFTPKPDGWPGLATISGRNSAGVMVGTVNSETFFNRPVRWDENAVPTVLWDEEDPAIAINEAGDIITSRYLLQGAVRTAIEELLLYPPRDINDVGGIVSEFTLRLDDTTYHVEDDLFPKGSLYHMADCNAVNNRNWIAGRCFVIADNSQRYGYVLRTDLGCFKIAPLPASTFACGNGTATFSVTPVGPGPFSYQWRRAATPEATPELLMNDGNISGADTASLIVLDLTEADAQLYDVVVTNDCGSVTSTASALAVCTADVNCDAFVNSQDFFDFLTAFFAQEPSADFNHDIFINSQDFFDFLAAFFEGC